MSEQLLGPATLAGVIGRGRVDIALTRTSFPGIERMVEQVDVRGRFEVEDTGDNHDTLFSRMIDDTPLDYYGPVFRDGRLTRQKASVSITGVSRGSNRVIGVDFTAPREDR